MKKRLLAIIMLLFVVGLSFGCTDEPDLTNPKGWKYRLEDELATPQTLELVIGSWPEEEIVFTYKYDGEHHLPDCTLYIAGKYTLKPTGIQKDIYDPYRDTWDTAVYVIRAGTYNIGYYFRDTVNGQYISEGFGFKIIIEK